jgi:hypothetical protein
MYMRSIAYIAIVALAATQGMGVPRDEKFIFNNPLVSSQEL